MRARDERHHNCVDRQTYHAMGMWSGGFALAAALIGLQVPGWLIVVVAVVGLLIIPALHLHADTEERRRARLTDEDRAAGRW